MLKEGGLSSAQITAATNQAYVHRGVGLKELAQLDSGTEWLLAHAPLAHTHAHTRRRAGAHIRGQNKKAIGKPAAPRPRKAHTHRRAPEPQTSKQQQGRLKSGC